MLTFDENITLVWFCACRVKDLHVKEQDLRLLVRAEDGVFSWLQVGGELHGIDSFDVSRWTFVSGIYALDGC